MDRCERISTAFQELELWKSGTTTEFRVKGAIHAWHDQHQLLTGQAWDLIAAAPILRSQGEPRSILMLGLAGGTSLRVLRYLLPEAKLTAIDIDAEMIALARKHMALDEIDIEVICADAYQWLAQNQRQFDVVVDDLYLAGTDDVFRSRSWGDQTLEKLRRAVAPGGMLAINLVTGSGHRTQQIHSRKIMRETFPATRVLKTPEAMNEVLIGAHELAPPACLRMYADSFEHPQDQAYWRRITLSRF